ncbi:MAG: tRNA 2-thiouridine(34) synthase MnmA [Planctomycetota bacterium]
MKLFVAMSGGVDSAVAALLLKRAGHEVVGIHLRTGVKGDPAAPGSRPRCCGADEAADAARVCALLEIPFYVQNTERAFRGLIDDFADAYARGATPNPCVACNHDIKFGALLERARALGAQGVATGHYARRIRRGGRWAIARAVDESKDQSYVLYGLRQEELAFAHFPLGDLRKAEVRALAGEAGLPVAEKAESQEICFVPSGDYRDLVRTLRPEAFTAGTIIDEGGAVLGEHPGVGGFTVGQRKGLGLAAEEPLYVLRIDPVKRQVVVGPRSSLGARGAELEEMRWMGMAEPRAPREVEAVLRYRAMPVPATVEVAGTGGGARLRFANAAWPVSPGQAAVLYDEDVVLGGGRIRSCS